MVIKSSKVMVVDDEPVNLRLVQKILNNAGYHNVLLVDDSRRVLEEFQQGGVDLILLDLNMPHLDGYEVMKQIQALNMPVPPPVLVLTAQNAREFKVRALELGARDFVTKPFDQVELVARVRNLLEAHLYQQSIYQEKDKLEQLVAERTSELHDTRLEIVRRLGRAAEYRDNETGYHIIRMSKIAALLGEASGMNAHQCDLLLNAAPMHDIGKIGIPDQILLKPGKLDAEEWEIMKTHAQIGADILSGAESELMQMARDIALSHHEKWDGSGYPNGLTGDAIPLVGRITAIADVFDALTSDRPYKKGWPLEKALEFIKEQDGQHFDPELVCRFMDQLPKIRDIYLEYSEPGEFQEHLSRTG